MLNKVLILILIFFSFNTFSETDETEKVETKQVEVDVVVAQEKILKFDFTPDKSSLPANENVVTTKFAPARKEIILIGLKPGETTLNVRDTTGEIKARYLLKISANDQSKVILQLRELLSDVEGLEIGLKGDSVYVGGQIVVPSDIGKVVVILDKYPEVLRLVELSPQTQVIIAKKMQDEMQNSSLKDVTVRVVNGSFWIEGVVNSKDESDKAEQIARAYLPDKIENLARRIEAVQSTKKTSF